MASIVKNSSKSAWDGMFQKVGHDIDRIVTSYFDVKDLNVLAVCKRWKDNASLASLKGRCILEWRKDQAAIAAGCNEWLVQFLRGNNICFWDLPLHAHDGSPLPKTKIDMPIINGTSCSIAQFRNGRDLVGLVFALQSKKKGFILADPLGFVSRRRYEKFKLQFTLLSPENIEPGTNIENPLQVYIMPVMGGTRMMMKFTAYHTAPCCLDVSSLDAWEALDAIAPLLSNTHQEIGLANRVMHVLPENSPPIPDAIPLVLPRPTSSTTFTKNNIVAILLGLCLASFIRYLWNLSRE